MRILVVDDEKVIRIAVLQLLKIRSDWEVVGEANDGLGAIEKARELMPDVIIMDLSMPNMNGLKATKEIRRTTPDAKILIFTQHCSAMLVREAKDAGAGGFLLKSDAQKLMQAVETISRHESFFGAFES